MVYILLMRICKKTNINAGSKKAAGKQDGTICLQSLQHPFLQIHTC